MSDERVCVELRVLFKRSLRLRRQISFRLSRFPVMLAKFIPRDSHHVIGYEDWVHRVFMEACHPHLQIDLLANLQCEHNARNTKRKTVPTSRRSLGGSGEDYQCILGPRDHDRETDILG